MTYTPAILDEIGIGIFADTDITDTYEEAQFLWDWAVTHKRHGVRDNEAVWWFFQMIAYRKPELAVDYLRVNPRIIRHRMQAYYPTDNQYVTKISDRQMLEAVMQK